MAPVPVMERFAWHVRGAQRTHLGPEHREADWTPPADSTTLCGFTMGLAWLPGWGVGPAMRQAETCSRCHELWWARYGSDPDWPHS